MRRLLSSPWVKRAAAVAGTGVGGVVLFPVVEDFYWQRKDPQRLVTNNSLATRNKEKKELLILGTGWGSVSVLKHIDRDKYNVTIVSPRNYFLFTPLLPVSSFWNGMFILCFLCLISLSSLYALGR